MDLSVIVPAYNEERFVAECCETLENGLKGLGLSYELIVVNNGSTDRTVNIIENIKYISWFSIERASVSYARNYGFRKSSGRFLAFIDADVVVCRRWVDAIKNLIKDYSITQLLTGFQYFVRPNATWIERYWFSNIESSHINGGNLIISRDAFEHLKGFNENLKTGEDVDLCDRAKLSKLVKYEPNKEFETLHMGYPRTLSHFMKREAWHGEGDFSSLGFFLRSKIALVSTLYALIQTFILVLIYFDYKILSVVLFLFLVTINLSITIIRFKGLSVKAYFFNFVLNYLYFNARFSSLFKAVLNNRKRY